MSIKDFTAHSASQHGSLSTASSLIGNLQEASPERWQSFVLVYSPLLRFWIRQDKVKPDSVDDVLQETLKSVFHGIRQFRWNAGSGTFRGWLRTIVKRRSVDHFRNQPRDQLVQQGILEKVEIPEQKDPGETEAEEKALLDLKARALELVRQSTAEKTWQMFWMSAVEGLPSPDIARKFQVTTAAVRVAKARVLNRLRELMPDM
jgi:RNA polymerase sigma-70 factor (ECF subfamily)